LKNVDYTFDKPIFKDDDYAKLTIKKKCLHFHHLLHISYTAYDGTRKEESVKPFLDINSGDIASRNSDHCMIMLASSEDIKIAGGHPFWYAQVLGIFHCLAYCSPSVEYKWLDILWVRWFGRETGFKAGPSSRCLDKIGFVEGTNSSGSPFGFVDPNDIIQSAHLMPSFHEGRISNLLGQESFVQDGLGHWSFYYVGR
jgi:hypothetical protein